MEIYQPSDLTVELMESKNKKNAYIASSNNVLSFGFFPCNNNGWPESPIKLKLGNIGVGKSRRGGFGLRHIWEKHGKECGLAVPADVILFIEKIISSGAKIIIDKDKAPSKPLIIKSKVGMAILKLNTPNQGGAFYTITSAYNRKNHPGNVIATFK